MQSERFDFCSSSLRLFLVGFRLGFLRYHHALEIVLVGAHIARMASDDEGVHVYYGTPLVSEEELNPRKRKTALDQGKARHVAPWNQEVSISHVVLIRDARVFLGNPSFY